MPVYGFGHGLVACDQIDDLQAYLGQPGMFAEQSALVVRPAPSLSLVHGVQDAERILLFHGEIPLRVKKSSYTTHMIDAPFIKENIYNCPAGLHRSGFL